MVALAAMMLPAPMARVRLRTARSTDLRSRTRVRLRKVIGRTRKLWGRQRARQRSARYRDDRDAGARSSLARLEVAGAQDVRPSDARSRLRLTAVTLVRAGRAIYAPRQPRASAGARSGGLSIAPGIEYLHQAASWPARARAMTGTYIGELQRLLTENASYDPWLDMEMWLGAPAWRFEAIIPLKGPCCQTPSRTVCRP
jgi:hypothetical protein